MTHASETLAHESSEVSSIVVARPRPMRVRLAVTLAVLLGPPGIGWSQTVAADHMFERVADLNLVPVSVGSRPEPVGQAGELVVFATTIGGGPYTGGYEGEIWASDGTGEGTVRVRESIELWKTAYGVVHTASLGDRLLFPARASESPIRSGGLWATDGSREGTGLVTPNAWGGHRWAPTLEIVELGDRAYFASWDDDTGSELWSTDGTVEGTRLEVDYCSGSDPYAASTYPSQITALGDRLVFVNRNCRPVSLVGFDPSTGAFESLLDADNVWGLEIHALEAGEPFAVVARTRVQDDVPYVELWRTDGTVAGTHLTYDFGPAEEIWHVATSGSLMYFTTKLLGSPENVSGLWRTDGTTEGTIEVQPCVGECFDMRGWAAGGGIDGWLAYISQPHGSLWLTDGTASGTQRISETTAGDRLQVVALGSQAGRRGRVALLFGYGSIVVSDGSVEGTAAIPGVVAVGATDHSSPQFVLTHAEINGVVYFPAVEDQRGEDLWRSDGTVAGTSVATEIPPGGTITRTRVLGSLDRHVLFTTTGRSGSEPWIYDTVSTRAWQLADLVPGNAPSAPSKLSAGRSVGYVLANDGVHGQQVWVTDGTTAGTRRIGPEIPGWEIGYFREENPIVTVGDRGFLYVNDPVDGVQLWTMTPDEVYLVQGFEPGTGSFVQVSEALVPIRDGVVFLRRDEPHTLWMSNGARGDVHEFARVGLDTIISERVAVDDRLFFTTSTNVGSRELWVSDGTSSGTSALISFSPPSGRLTDLLPNADGVSFLGPPSEGSSSFRALWVSDGTVEGTRRVVDMPSLETTLDEALWHRRKLFFSAKDSEHGIEPWVVDGESAEVRLVKDLGPATSWGSDPGAFTASGEWVYFLTRSTSEDATENRVELWRTNGLEEDTIRLTVLPSQWSSERVDLFATLGGVIVKSRASGPNPVVVSSDGSPEGTIVWSSTDGLQRFHAYSPPMPVLLGNRLLFVAADHSGAELWSFRLPNPEPRSGAERLRP